MEDKAKLLMVGSLGRHQQGFVAAMEARGWSVDTVSDSPQSLPPCFAEYGAGLYCLGPADFPAPKALEQLVLRSDLAWMALVDGDLPAEAALRATMANLFIAFHQAPPRVEQIDCLMTHVIAMQRLRTSAVPQVRTDQAETLGLLSGSPALGKMIDSLPRVAAVDAPVFLSGEIGTGKARVARAIHACSPRAAAPLVAVSCATLPAGWLRGECTITVSGHTASHGQPAEPLAKAAGGTLFLDEVSELSAPSQCDLLHLIEHGSLPDPGTGRLVPFDVRVIASTHADLEAAVEAGRFRPDLYHHLRVLEVEVPPLRERQEDIEALAYAIFQDYEREKSPSVRGFSQEALVLMKQYAWPGNLRELVNRVRRAMVMCEQRLIKPGDLGLERRSSNRHIVTLEEARNVAEREVLLNALNRSQYKIKKAADELGVSRVTLYRLMEKHGLDRKAEPEAAASQ